MNDHEMHDAENLPIDQGNSMSMPKEQDMDFLPIPCNMNEVATVNNVGNMNAMTIDNTAGNMDDLPTTNTVGNMDDMAIGNMDDMAMVKCNLDLPVEVWMIILSYVDPEDLPAVAMVNHKFADFANECSLWTSLKISARKLVDNPKLFLDKICWYTWLNKLYITGDHQGCRPKPNFQDIVNGCQSNVNDKDCKIVNMDDKVPEKFFRNIATHCQRLKVLRIFDCVLDQSYINQLAIGCPELKVIELSRCELVGVGLTLPRFKNLRVFNMVDCDYQRST